MVQRCETVPAAAPAVRAPRVSYRHSDAARLLAEADTLAVFGFGAGHHRSDDPRWLQVDLEPFDAPAPLELWQVDGPVSHGREGALRWSCGGGWLFTSIVLEENEHGGIDPTAERIYEQLTAFVAGRSERHVQRIWNYLADITAGAGDTERYKGFCNGRARGMGDSFSEGFPAATAIGHHASARRLQVYLLSCGQPGERVENPRQVSAWRYPRQYGPTPPSFARAMVLPGRDALAISGTAAVVGHASAHENDLHAQLVETFANLEALLASAGMGAGFDTHSPLKAYVRRSTDVAQVREFINQHIPGVPVLLLHGDICRSELLIEIDGWRYA